MVESIFRGGLAFLEQVGIYDIVLPFLLVFTLVFALLEKTKILGIQKDMYNKDDTSYAKKNLNSMVAFVIAFFVIASSKLVALINQTVSQIFILLLLAVMFMLVVGTFNKDAEFSFTKAQQGIFATVMGIAIILIFLNALGWLELAYDFLKINWSGEAVSAIILVLLMAAFIGFLGKPTKVVEKKKEDKVED